MRQHYDKLLSLINQLPRHNSSRSVGELSTIFSNYKSILNSVNQTDDDYRRNTKSYYEEISRIQSDIQGAQKGKSQKQKDKAFFDAISGLELDIEALADLINTREQFD